MAAEKSPELQRLIDRQRIRDVIHRYARAVDRHDEDMIRSVFHPDAVDNHGPFYGTLPEFIDWVNTLHENKALSHTHNICCHICDLDGDVAHTESYIIWVLRYVDEKTVLFGTGRYIDRLEKRNGEWRIAVRRVMTDGRIEADGSGFNKPDGYPRGRWDREDLSYQRPLTLPSELAAKLQAKAS
jgi:3-phenylpropionate/cinnamic acid dioxygenase small subunit